MSKAPWRVGRKVGRTLYEGDVLVGLMDTPALAAQVAWSVNASEDLRDGIEACESIIEREREMMKGLGQGHITTACSAAIETAERILCVLRAARERKDGP